MALPIFHSPTSLSSYWEEHTFVCFLGVWRVSAVEKFITSEIMTVSPKFQQLGEVYILLINFDISFAMIAQQKLHQNCHWSEASFFSFWPNFWGPLCFVAFGASSKIKHSAMLRQCYLPKRTHQPWPISHFRHHLYHPPNHPGFPNTNQLPT